MRRPREEIEADQLEQVRRLFRTLESAPNPFYAERLRPVLGGGPLASLEDFRARVPWTTKDDLVEDRRAHPPFGSNLTFPLRAYTRFCQTSGTGGEPLAWLDTPESWGVLLDCWKAIYRAAGVSDGGERIFFAFSFGPFLGFWTAFEAAAALGMLCIPGGGMSTPARLAAMRRLGVTVLCCTPTYALRLGEAARQQGDEPPRVRLLIVAGEPGGSIAATRERLRELWKGARVFDHHGMTEVGPVSHEDPEREGSLVVLEESYLAEVIDPATGAAVPDGSCGELVLTTLRRTACPLIRYRTGDLVRARRAPHLVLEGGILGRLDDMVLVRGVNVYPGAIEAVLRQFPEVAEYEVRESWRESMTELEVAVELGAEAAPGVAGRIESRLRESLQLRIPVREVESGQLPRHEFKARRWVRLGEAEGPPNQTRERV